MKKTLLILSLAAGLVSTSAIAQQDPHSPYKATEAAVPAPVAQWIQSNNVHVNFFSQEKAEAFADKFGIPHSRITTYTIASKVSTKEPQKIYAINYILPSKKDMATR